MKKGIKILLVLSVILLGSLFIYEDRDSNLTAKKVSEIPILMYHSVDDIFPESKIRISTRRFEDDLIYIRDKGYNVISFNDLIDYDEGRKELPEKPLIISFDDGQRNNYENAYPLLKKYRMRASIFLIASRQGVEKYKGDKLLSYFNWEEAREMEGSGIISVEPHSYELHNYRKNKETGKGLERAQDETRKDYRARLDRDFAKIEEVFERELSKKPNVYAYPFGIHTRDSEEVLKNRGYKVSLLTGSKMADISKNLYGLKRFNMGFDRPIESILK